MPTIARGVRRAPRSARRFGRRARCRGPSSAMSACGDDADERAALVDDRDAADLLGAHRLHESIDVVGLVGRWSARRCSWRRARCSCCPAFGDAADRDVAIGDDADEPTVPRPATTGTMPTSSRCMTCAASRTVASGVTLAGSRVMMSWIFMEPPAFESVLQIESGWSRNPYARGRGRALLHTRAAYDGWCATPDARRWLALYNSGGRGLAFSRPTPRPLCRIARAH